MTSLSINLRSLISVCSTPLGMESGAIKDSQITASTQWGDNHATSRARLNLKFTGVKRGAWSSRVLDLKQWLQVDLGSYTTVTGVATQGRNGYRPGQWVTKYRLQYSNDGVNFHFYKEKDDNSFKLFDGNQDTDSSVYHKLARQITARYIRFIPVEWRNHISMRVEIYGCEGCLAPLGLEDGTITDIQVDLGRYTRVTRVANQGLNASNEWVTKYKLQYSDDGKNFHYYKQQGDNKWTVRAVYVSFTGPPKIQLIYDTYTIYSMYDCPGMESQAIEDAQISASSQLDGNHSVIQGRLHLKRNDQKQGGWSALTNDLNQWLQVDLNTFARITVIATQGRHGFKEWVTKYSFQYSNDGCVSPYGMKNRKISDSQIKSSSQLDENLSAKHSRLHSKANRENGGSWSALKNDVKQWLQVDLGSYIRVTDIATQGRNGHDEWVTKFRLQCGEDEDIFHFFEDPEDFAAMVFKGNADSDTVVYNALAPPIITRYIRFKPAEWHNRISIRIEIYGCPGCINPLGMAYGSISDIHITASSQLDGNHSASQARLHFQADGYKVGGWSALSNDRNQWLQVDFGKYTTVTRLATRGVDGYNQWVTKYMLQYSDDGINFHLYKEAKSSSAKVPDVLGFYFLC
ncbi:Coagulation factor V [Stylophora pistillata]|uniref:Coagulation factor V n=1 Tax=Stylophora pistillata TaxID=50429 RepID=A0A2B4STC7_STYPI|nr:Coagulation factor V [Stylophora pistillata]